MSCTGMEGDRGARGFRPLQHVGDSIPAAPPGTLRLTFPGAPNARRPKVHRLRSSRRAACHGPEVGINPRHASEMGISPAGIPDIPRQGQENHLPPMGMNIVSCRPSHFSRAPMMASWRFLARGSTNCGKAQILAHVGHHERGLARVGAHHRLVGTVARAFSSAFSGSGIAQP